MLANLDNFFRQSAITPTVFMEVDREDTIMTLVRSGLGATILPRCVLSGGGMTIRFVSCGCGMPICGVMSGLVDMAIELCWQHFHANHDSPEAMISSAR